jgi:hypothetical protein
VTSYPLVFNFTNIVRTKNYHAAVTTRGRALLIHHDEEGQSWVCSGVEPGGIDAEADLAFLANREFATEFQSVLENIASESTDFRSFEAAVKAFFHDKNRDAEKLWAESVIAIRAGRNIEPALNGLERKPDAPDRGIEVTMLHNLVPDSWNDQVALVADTAKAA